jgi:hypothetical protein
MQGHLTRRFWVNFQAIPTLTTSNLAAVKSLDYGLEGE